MMKVLSGCLSAVWLAKKQLGKITILLNDDGSLRGQTSMYGVKYQDVPSFLLGGHVMTVAFI